MSAWSLPQTFRTAAIRSSSAAAFAHISATGSMVSTLSTAGASALAQWRRLSGVVWAESNFARMNRTTGRTRFDQGHQPIVTPSPAGQSSPA